MGENNPVNIPLELAQRFDRDELVAAIAQDATTQEVLMLAWMNRESLSQTLETGRVTYWSRSRNSLWVKGESSGHTQHLRSAHLDCDGDAILLVVDQVGAACHTGERTCFHTPLARESESNS
jgi:phosphoribosyl-AMP cyclohydrolase